jgi:hypothetical protein
MFSRHSERSRWPGGFIPLKARPENYWARLCGSTSRGKFRFKARDWEKAKAEGKQLARWIEAVSLDKLRARSWEEVAILCPRKMVRGY